MKKMFLRLQKRVWMKSFDFDLVSFSVSCRTCLSSHEIIIILKLGTPRQCWKRSVSQEPMPKSQYWAPTTIKNCKGMMRDGSFYEARVQQAHSL